jgi:hypothetical protein
VGAYTVDVAVYRGAGAETDGDVLGGEEMPATAVPSDELSRLRRRIKALRRRVENAIANHEFAEANACSEEEREARALLKEKLAQAGESAPPAPPTPVLCIEIVRDRKFPDLQRRWDAHLSMGVAQVWLLDLAARRAYTVTAAEGIRECKQGLLRLPDPVLELDLTRLFA